MRIAELSRRSGVPLPTIKFYLRTGLLARGTRTARNQAEYSEGHVWRLRLIRTLAEIGGLPLDVVRKVLDAIDDERVPLHDMLGVAHYALGPALDTDDPSADFAKALAEVDGLLTGLGWKVGKDAPARGALARALVTLRRLGRAADVRLFEPYAHVAERLAARELATIDLREPRGQVVEDIVVGTVVFEAVLVALRRLAQEHHALARLAKRGGPRARKPRGRTPGRG